MTHSRLLFILKIHFYPKEMKNKINKYVSCLDSICFVESVQKAAVLNVYKLWHLLFCHLTGSIKAYCFHNGTRYVKRKLKKTVICLGIQKYCMFLRNHAWVRFRNFRFASYIAIYSSRASLIDLTKKNNTNNNKPTEKPLKECFQIENLDWIALFR